MITSPLASAQDFIKALKALPDPPHVNGPSKIELARKAWYSTNLDFPNKDEVVVDWLLTRLLKDKTKAGAANPILDLRYWQLLSDTLYPLDGEEAKSADTSHTARTWLLPLLNRTPLAPIVTAYLTHSALLHGEERKTLNEHFARCLVVLWPSASLKFGPEVLLECFGVLLAYLATVKKEVDHCTGIDPHIARIGFLIISSYRIAYGNAANKKKLCTAFLQDYFLHWIQCSQADNIHHDTQRSLVVEAFSAGVDTLFHVDILRSVDDHKCDTALRDAIDRALLSSRGAVLCTLPRLFASFVHSLKKNRNTLYSQGSNTSPRHAAVQVQIDGLAFYALCQASISGSPDSDGSLTWDTTISLLTTVDNEGLYNASDANGTQVLRSSGNAAVKLLTSSHHDTKLVDKALDALSLLMHIDYDLMLPELPVIWPVLAHRSPSPSSLSYLCLLFDFHAKTRTVNALVDAWLDAVSCRHLESTALQPREVYNKILGGALFTFEVVDRLGQVIHAFLTPGQIANIARSNAEKLQTTFRRFHEQDMLVASEAGDGARKKRRKSTVEDARIDPEKCAVEFALVARIVVIVLGSLPIRTVPDDSRREIFDSVSAAYATIVPRAFRAVIKALDADSRQLSWAWQIVATGALLVHHDLKSRGWPEIQMGDGVKKQLRTLLGDGDALPEFSLTIVRALLNDSASSSYETQEVLSDVLNCLESAKVWDDGDDVRWTGRVGQLNEKGASAAVAFLHLVLSRWLSLYDSRATSEQLARLVQIILRLGQNASSTPKTPTITPATMLATTLHRADVWELPRFRDAFLEHIREATEILASVDAQALLSGANGVPRTLHAEVSSGIATFEILLHAPEEYITRPLRLDFLRRAIVADVIMGTTAITGMNVDSRQLVIIREYIRRAVFHYGGVEQVRIDGYLAYLLKPPSGDSQTLASATLELIGTLMSVFLRHAKGGEVRYAVEAVQEVKQCLAVPTKQKTHTAHSITDGALLRLVSTVASNYDISQLSPKMRESLRDLCERMVAYSIQLMRTYSGAQPQLHDPIDSECTALRLWSHTLWLGRWIGTNLSGLPRFGALMLGRLLADRHRSFDREAYLALLDVLKEELLSDAPEHSETYVGCVVATYITCARSCDPKDMHGLDATLSNLSKGLTTADYAITLDYIVEAASATSCDVKEIASLLHLLKVVGLSAPEGTSKITQQTVSTTLSVCANRPSYLAAPPIRSQVLRLLADYCSERPAYVRPSDMSTMWSILGQLLENSPEHDNITYPAVFQEIVNIISALVRLRRDLVVNSLPHLGMILRGLINALRAPRPHLGAMQIRLVMNTLPAWITAEQAMSVEEAKALARLMTTLTTKTIVRNHAQNAETQRPESLARPFSKHATYVLTAYIEAVIDPFCHIATQVRKEMQLGLFALCDMIGDHNRDAMMVSALDANGKVMMKALWKEYEKQRYVGRG